MKLKTLLSKAMKANPELANLCLPDGAAIVFNDDAGLVQSLRIDMTEERLEAICDNIANCEHPSLASSRLA